MAWALGKDRREEAEQSDRMLGGEMKLGQDKDVGDATVNSSDMGENPWP
jgi:hypothetical protein